MGELVRPIAPVTDAIALAKLTAFFRRGRYDVVHTHSSKAGILGRLAARAAGVPIVVHTLHSLVFGEHATPTQNASTSFLKRLVAPLTHRFISVCDATRRGAWPGDRPAGTALHRLQRLRHRAVPSHP